MVAKDRIEPLEDLDISLKRVKVVNKS